MEALESPPERIGPFTWQRHAPVLPTLRDGVEPTRHPVAIVGGGPVGLAVALGLARHGVSSVVLEADDTVCIGSRAACISRRSLEILDRLGVLADFMAKGLPWTGGRSYYRDEEVFRFSMPHDATQKLPPMINLQQYYIEQFLVDGVRRSNEAGGATIDIRWGTSADEFEPREDGVSIAAANRLGRYRLQANWLVACDGGQSGVRKQLGLSLTGTAYEGRYVIIDIELPSDHPAERRAWFDPPWNRGSTVLMHRQPDDIWRIDYQLRIGEDPEDALRPDRVDDFVRRHLAAIGEGHLPWKPVWTSIYRAGAMTLDRYRHGRILFAGNAAHAMPIFGVRGLNSGFDDADNLAWKLAAVINGKGGDALLDSYSSERVQAFHVNAESAMRSTEFMSPPNRGFELMREACLSLAGRHAGIARLINPRQTHAVTYEHSVLSSAGDGFECGPVEGAPLEDMPLRRGVHLTDLLDPRGCTVLAFGQLAVQREIEAAVASPAWRLLPATCVVIDGAADAAGPGRAEPPLYQALMQRYGAAPGSVVLVRPDGHVCGRWHQPSAATVLAAIERACGAPRSSDA